MEMCNSDFPTYTALLVLCQLRRLQHSCCPWHDGSDAVAQLKGVSLVCAEALGTVLGVGNGEAKFCSVQ